MNRTRPTVADIRALKGVRQLSMIHIEDRDEARACAAAGIDVLSIETPIWDASMPLRPHARSARSWCATAWPTKAPTIA